MPTVAITFHFQAYRFNAPPITDDEFLGPLSIQAGEVESAWSWKAKWGGAGVRIVTVRSAWPVADSDFDGWVADACAAVVRFLNGRPVGAYDQLRAAGLVDLRLCADVLYVDECPIVDFPNEVYDTCRRHNLGIVSTWELPEELRPTEPDHEIPGGDS